MSKLWLLLVLTAIANAEILSFTVDPARSTVSFTVGAALHTVHGTFAVKSGTMEYDGKNGKTSGRLVIDVTSGKSGDAARDKRMHKEILESARFPEAIFTPDAATGSPETALTVHGTLDIHGTKHEITAPVKIEGTSATGTVTIPYVEWGMKNPSNFLLKVSDKAEVTLHLVFKPASQPSAAR